MTRTPLIDDWLSDQPDPGQALNEAMADIPLARLATATDIAAAVSYLASTDAAYLTGICLPIDGGYTAR
jgi:NAD(P)-dependent dehydrogenase (short-subunit alcohol dehydrogenase family)